MSAPDLDPTERHAKMIAAATWLAKHHFGRIGWGDQRDGKGPVRSWKSDATDDPAQVAGLLRGARNALVIPTGRALIIDIDVRDAWGELVAAGLPETFTIDSPTTDHGHVYGWVPEGIDMATIPGTFTGGELRRQSPTTGTASMVLGPFAKRGDGIYTPRPGPRVIAALPVSVIEYLIASARVQSEARSTARGPADDGWRIATGRHDWLVSKARNLRGIGLSGERLLEELRRLDRERCDPPLADVPGRGLVEIERIAGWTEQHIADDQPAIITTSRDRPIDASPFPEPEDRGKAVLSEVGTVEYVDDLVRPGRILVVSGEEGTGKSYAITGELAIRTAVAGGTFAGTWEVLRTGPVLVLSEMHGDDDYQREADVLAALGRDRADLASRYYRLSLMTAAGDKPALMVPEWREWATGWMRERGVLLLVVDTATGATQIDPWGQDIQDVYRSLRLMIDAYPALSVVLLLHMRKANGRGERGISAVMGEWGRWCDVVLMMENDGSSLVRVKLTARKRVRRERRVIATKRGGLLVDPIDADATGPKVPTAAVLAAMGAEPGITYADLGKRLGVSKDTAARYVKALGDAVDVAPTGPRGASRVYLTAAPPQTAARAHAADRTRDRRTAARTYIGAAVRAAVGEPDAVDLTGPALDIFGDILEPPG